VEYTEIFHISILAYLANLGGLGSFLFEAGVVLTRFLAYDLFIASLMSLLFTIKMVHPKDCQEDHPDSNQKRKRKSLFR